MGWIESQFETVSPDDYTDYGIGYDYASIMHYPPGGWFTTRNASFMDVVGASKLSKGDAEILNRAYCGNRGAPFHIHC